MSDDGCVQYEVRRATEDDLPGLEAVYLRAWRAAYEGVLPHDALEEQATIREEFDWSRCISAPEAEVLVAVDRTGSVLGVVQADEVVPPPRDLPEITMLYVDPEAWGTGASVALLAAGVVWIAGRGHAAARLRVVETQARARRFYEREGWTRDEEMEPAHNGFFPLLYYRRSLGA